VDLSLERRIEILEGNMEQLRDVPARLSAVESQVVQLRSEMRDGFSALRGEMHACEERLRAEMRQGHQTLRAEMRTLNEETNAHLRVLHEEVISRIAVLPEGRPASPRRSRRRKTR